MDAKEFELPIEGSFVHLISQCYQQSSKLPEAPKKEAPLNKPSAKAKNRSPKKITMHSPLIL
ncbi:MAG: hypothetical protein U0T77_02335 [Chitinophagales bacterium]